MSSLFRRASPSTFLPVRSELWKMCSSRQMPTRYSSTRHWLSWYQLSMYLPPALPCSGPAYVNQALP